MTTMTEWHINSDLEYLHRVIDSAMSGSVSATPVFLRLFRLSVLSLIQSINIDLDQMNRDLDVAVMLEGASIDFDKYLDDKYWSNSFLLDDGVNMYKTFGIDINTLTFQKEINLLTDYFPNDVEGYNITPDLMETFKYSMHQLCDMDKLGNREIIFSLTFGLSFMITQLSRIKKKVEHPQAHQYIKVWEEIYEQNDYITHRQSYIEWKEENEGYKVRDLKRQHLYEIYLLLESGFFKHFNSVTGADVKNRKLIITNDDLPVGCSISDTLATECAKFERFFEWKEDYIVSMNYEKLGKYIYKNYSKLNLNDLRRIVEFDKTIDKINEDIADLKPNLAKYLKSYEDTIVNNLIKDCSSILNTCQQYLAKDIRTTFFQDYLAERKTDFQRIQH